MARIEYDKIKARHAAASGISENDRFEVDEGGENVTVTADIETWDAMGQMHRDMDALIKEHDRFVANYREALEFIDSFAMSHKNVLPRRTAEGLTDLQARLRGLL